MERLSAWFCLVVLLSVTCAKSPPLVLGVPNLSEVSPGVWRSAQPENAAEWRAVAALGVRTVIKLNFEDEGSDDPARALGLEVHDLGIEPAGDQDVFDNTFRRPDMSRVDEAVRLLLRGGGVLVHCTHGQDRTGLVVGIYRLEHDGWYKERAYDEMLAMGFHPELHGLHETWEGLEVDQ